jgi:Ca-activated chloride channel homolog
VNAMALPALAVASIAAIGALPQGGDTGGPSVSITSPGENSYVSGPVLLRAEITPVYDVTTVTFFVDGTRVCSVARSPYECNWDAGSHVVEHDVRVVVSLKAGGRLVRSVRTKSVTYAEHVDVDAVQVTATVSKDGRFVSGLPVAVFRVFEDGKPQRITGFADSRVPLDLVVAVDISGSMEAAIPALKAAVREFLAAVPDKDTVTLLGFNDNIFTIARRATSPAERVAGLDNLAAWGATALYDVVVKAIELLGTGSGRKAIVVFTDGEDQGSHVSFDEVLARVRESDAAIYMIGQGRGVTQAALGKVLQQLAAPTGGRAVLTDRIEELRKAFRQLLDEISNQYLLSYIPPGERRPGTWHAIKVQVDGYPQIRARQGYMTRAK